MHPLGRHHQAAHAVLHFWSKYWLGHPENYLCLLSKNHSLDQSIKKKYYLILKTEALSTWLISGHEGSKEPLEAVMIYKCVGF